MSTAQVTASNGVAEDDLRESWRQVMSMRRSTKQFRARVGRALPSVEMAIGVDPQFADVTAVMAAMVRILDWAVGDLDRLKLPEELFEMVPSRVVIPSRESAADGPAGL
jgi:hypothetical protein